MRGQGGSSLIAALLATASVACGAGGSGVEPSAEALCQAFAEARLIVRFDYSDLVPPMREHQAYAQRSIQLHESFADVAPAGIREAVTTFAEGRIRADRLLLEVSGPQDVARADVEQAYDADWQEAEGAVLAWHEDTCDPGDVRSGNPALDRYCTAADRFLSPDVDPLDATATQDERDLASDQIDADGREMRETAPLAVRDDVRRAIAISEEMTAAARTGATEDTLFDDQELQRAIQEIRVAEGRVYDHFGAVC